MPKSLFGKISSPDSGSLVPSSWTIDFSLIENPSGDTTVIWRLRIGILPQLTLSGMVKSRQLTKL